MKKCYRHPGKYRFREEWVDGKLRLWRYRVNPDGSNGPEVELGCDVGFDVDNLDGLEKLRRSVEEAVRKKLMATPSGQRFFSAFDCIRDGKPVPEDILSELDATRRQALDEFAAREAIHKKWAALGTSSQEAADPD